MNRWKGSALAVALLAGATSGLLTAPPSSAAVAEKDPARYGRNYDRRLTLEGGAVSFSAAQSIEIAGLRAQVPDLLVEIDHTTGGTRSLFSSFRPLAPARAGNPEAIAVGFVADHLALLGLTADDVADYRVSNEVLSAGSGVTNIYLQQRHAGIPVYNAQLHATVGSDGALHKLGNQFVPNLAAALNTTQPAISGAAAIGRLRDQEGPLAKASTPTLAILPIRPGEARLVWNFVVETDDYAHWWDANVDAVDGRVWTLIDWIADDSYKVYETPIESPIVEVYPTPPPGPFPPTRPTTDERTVAVNPASAASPFGWHDTNGVAGAESTLTTGNNVNACVDRSPTNNVCDTGSQPDGGVTLDFAPVLDLTTAPTAGSNPAAAVVNLFYWNNIIHDIEYVYGFDEVAGNFQVNNYGNGGAGNDAVNADAQDGGGTCNANFGTPVDGQAPRMQMFLSGSGCWSGPPVNDGDLDNLVIVHEYGHGISNRLVGGPGNVSCLGNSEQPGEGLSDWWGLSLTAHPSQIGTTLRGTGTWLFYDLYPAGIRPQPYSTDPAINSYTYQSAAPLSVPHGVGSVWAQSYWEVYWALVDEHGFDPDFYNYTGTATDAGNIRAKRYLIEGLKASVCSPGFVNIRDGILAAAAANYGGEDVCTLWEAFAAFGLGFDAVQGTNSIGNEVNGFALPSTCSFGNAGSDVRVCTSSTTSHVQNVLVGPAYTTPPVDMSVAGNPAGSTVLWSEDPVSGPLPETVTLTLGSLNLAAAGAYTIDVTGLDGGALTNTDSFVLTLDASTPATTTLTAPADGALNQPVRPNFSWSVVAGTPSYILEVDNDPGFGSLAYTATVTGTSHTPNVDLASNTQFYWRVRASNSCGDGANSGVFDFTTVPAPGDCGAGSAAYQNAYQGWELGAGAWTSSGTGNSWASSNVRVHSGAASWRSTGPAVVSDQRLVSPVFALPASQASLSLIFWNHQTIEDQTGGTACFDGAIIEASTNGGSSWTQLLNPVLLTDPYNGPVSASFGNPIAGLSAWCGDPQDWTKSVVDISAYAGQNTQFRFRHATDNSVGREGWYIDDVEIQGCVTDLIFQDGYESGATARWSSTTP